MTARVIVKCKSKHSHCSPLDPLKDLELDVKRELKGWVEHMGVTYETEIWPQTMPPPFKGRKAILIITAEEIHWTNLEAHTYRAIRSNWAVGGCSGPLCTLEIIFAEGDHPIRPEGK